MQVINITNPCASKLEKGAKRSEAVTTPVNKRNTKEYRGASLATYILVRRIDL